MPFEDIFVVSTGVDSVCEIRVYSLDITVYCSCKSKVVVEGYLPLTS